MKTCINLGPSVENNFISYSDKVIKFYRKFRIDNAFKYITLCNSPDS